MKRACVAALVCFFVPLMSHEAPLSLVECQSICLKNSESLNIRELLTRIEEEKIQQIIGINMPKVTLNADYGKRNNHLGSRMPNRMKDLMPPSEEGHEARKKMPDTIRSISCRKELLNSTTSLIVPIYDSEYVSNRVLSQEYIVDAFRHSRDRLEQRLLNEVAQSYYLLLESRKIEGVLLQSIETLRHELDKTSDLFSIGYVTENDVLVIEVQLAEREQELIQARNNSDLAYASLNRLMGQSLETSFDIQEISVDREWTGQCAYFQEQAELKHPDLKRITSEQEASRFDYKAIRAENLPKVDGILSYNTTSNSALLHKQWLFGGIGVRIPIFDGGIVESKLKQKNEEIESLDFSYASAQKNISLEIKRAFLKTSSAWKRIAVSKKSIRSAEENLRMTSEQYEAGLLSSDDLLNNEERLAQARSNYYQALYQFYMAKAELEFAAGIISINKV